jgi:hypothetical protein
LQAHFGHQGNVFAKTMIVIDGDVTMVFSKVAPGWWA